MARSAVSLTMVCQGATPAGQVTRVVSLSRDIDTSVDIILGWSRLALCPYCPLYSKGTLEISLLGPSRGQCYSRFTYAGLAVGWSEAMTRVQVLS